MRKLAGSPEGQSGSDLSSPPLPSSGSWSDRFRLIGQIATTAAIWDLCKVGKIEGSHALFAMVAIAAPGFAALLLSRRDPPKS
jgi:hypothetical protein